MQTQIKSVRLNRHRRAGFTLIEMIGVLAVIAILAAMLVPKVFEAINSARVNNAAVSCETVKTALADHYAKFGGIAVDGSGANPQAITVPNTGYAGYDQVLLKEGFLDKLFVTKIGNGVTGSAGTHVELFNAAPTTTPTTGVNDGAYDLDGDAGATTYVNDTSGVIVQAVIIGVTAQDAKDLNDRIDGPALGSAVGQLDIKGRVKFAAIPSGTGTVYVYLTHR